MLDSAGVPGWVASLFGLAAPLSGIAAGGPISPANPPAAMQRAGSFPASLTLGARDNLARPLFRTAQTHPMIEFDKGDDMERAHELSGRAARTDTALFQSELAKSLVACARVINAQYLIDYATAVISHRSDEPAIAEKFYALSIESLLELTREFLREAARRDFVAWNNVDRSADALFWAMCGPIFMQALFTGVKASEEEIEATADAVAAHYIGRNFTQ